MRVIAGTIKGLRLETLSNIKLRPTTDKVKESLFNILQFDIQNSNFLDLFGGSGQIGIEAASRGAAKVIIVDNTKLSINIIKNNLLKLKNNFNVSLVNSDAIDFLRNFKEKIDIAFLDPPYNSTLLGESFKYISPIMSKKGIIVTESSADKQAVSSIGEFCHIGRYKYGNIQLNIYKP